MPLSATISSDTRPQGEMESAYRGPCSVLGAHVTRFTDGRHRTTRVICGEYCEADGVCRLKKLAAEQGMREPPAEEADGVAAVVCCVMFTG